MNMLVTVIVIFITNNILMVMSMERIIGGSATSIHDFPYQLSLHYLGFPICGASLITQDIAVTAAHCAIKSLNMHFSIRGGSSLTNFGGVRVYVARIIKHPQYNSVNFDNDVAVLILSFPIYRQGSIVPIKLPQPNENPKTGEIAVVSGWGFTNGSFFESIFLRKVEVLIIDQNECKKNYSLNEVTNQMICAGTTQGGKDACQGDSGGPLMSRGKLVGIVSWGIGCGSARYPGVYTRIANPEILSFIKRYARI